MPGVTAEAEAEIRELRAQRGEVERAARRQDELALRQVARTTATISINGGPQVPLPVVKKALEVIKAGAAREAATGQPQSDLEEFTGVAPEQQQREAEAGQISAERLRSIVERVERLEEERKALAADIKDIYSEAKSAGFEPKVLRRLIRERRRKPAELEEEETLLDLYKRALGM